tara:strand:- start:1284 stop:1520 length:237 start_codon:yes stop_codon:yes gene_type:complete
MKTIKENEVKNQTDAVLWHLQNLGGLTSWQAIQEYGITRLSDKIHKLRKQGYDISSTYHKKTTRFGHKTSVAQYLLSI